MIHLLFRIQNFGRSLRGQGGPIRGSEVLNTTIQMEAGHPRENLKSPQQQDTQQPITQRFKRLMGLLLTISSSKQSCYQTKANDKKRTATGCKRQRICTLRAVTRNKITYKRACPNGPNSGSRKPFQNWLRSKGLPSCSSGGHKPHNFN